MNLEAVHAILPWRLRGALDGASPLWNKGVLTRTTSARGGAPMQALQSHDLLSSDTHAMDQLRDFLRQRREAREPVENLYAFEQELHRLFVAAEREVLGHELSRFDLDVPVLEVAGERHHRVLRCETTYQSAAGPVRVERSLYRPSQGGQTVCPLDLRADRKSVV